MHKQVFTSSTPNNQRLLLKPLGDKQIRISMSRNTLIALLVSIILHAFILLFIAPLLPQNEAPKPSTTLDISLAPAKVEEPVAPEIATEPPPVLPEKPIVKPIENKPKPKVLTKPTKTKQKPVFTVPDDLAKPTVVEPQPTPEVKANQESEPTDMASYIKAQQAKRNTGEADAARQNAEAAAREKGPSEDEKRDARIKNNLKVGTNGIFEITTLSGRHAAFSFKGWTNDYSNARREYFEVEASTGEDVRLVMIRKMISLIRQHYQGDFTWESQRLGRSIVKSARPEDSAELEDFLMMEFFGTRYKTSTK
jgi:outer membrane biosynthesis protein TonB